MPRGQSASLNDLTIMELQRQLHAENKRRFEQIEKNQDNQKDQLDQLLQNTAELPTLKTDVAEIKKQVATINTERDKVKGAAKLGAWLGGSGLAMGLFRWIFYGH